MLHRRTLTAILLLVAFTSLIFMSHLFRHETIENSALGTITYHYRWGKRAQVVADTNGDGVTDFRARIDHLHLPSEYWEDSDHDGAFEHHVLLDAGRILRIEIDEDGDGRFEQSLEGEEAEVFYRDSDRKILNDIRQKPIY